MIISEQKQREKDSGQKMGLKPNHASDQFLISDSLAPCSSMSSALKRAKMLMNYKETISKHVLPNNVHIILDKMFKINDF